jgi:hypothetical protein
MSEFSTIRIPPNSTGSRIAQTSVLEMHYKSIVVGKSFVVGDLVTTDSGMIGTVVKVKAGAGSSGEIYIRLDKPFSESNLVADEDIFHENEVVASVDLNATQIPFLTQNVVITGKNNPLNGVTVSDRGELYTRFSGGSMSYDAFGKLETSQSTTIREYLPVYDILPEDFDNRIWTNGVLKPGVTEDGDNKIIFDDTKKLIVLQTGTQTGDHVRRRSHLYHKYQTGVATSVIFSAFLGDSGKSGVHRKIGLYDDSDGVYFHGMEDSPNGFGIVIRHSVDGTVVNEHIHQVDWNVDRLNGEGGKFNVSGFTLDPTKIQVMFIDFQWLGGGRIRFGFNIDGVAIVCHEVNNANNIPRIWARTGSLPFTAEQYNTSVPSGVSQFFNVSAVVRCEGPYEPRQFLSSGSLPPAVSVGPNANGEDYTFIGAVRPVKYISYADNITWSGLTTMINSSAGQPQTPGQIINHTDDFLSAGFVDGDYIQIAGSNKNNRIIYEIDTVDSTSITMTTESPPMYHDSTASITIVSKKKTPNRAIGEVKDITLMDVSGQNKPLLIELIKNAGLQGSVSGCLSVDNIVDTTGGYIEEEIVDLSNGGGNGINAVGQVELGPGGDITSVYILIAGEGYSNTDSGLIITGRESGANWATLDVATVGPADFTWQDAYSGNMVDAAKPSTGVTGTTAQGNTVYTTLMKDGYVKLDLREHFERNTELMFRKAELDDDPDDWSIRVKTFNDGDTAQIALAISWLEVRS